VQFQFGEDGLDPLFMEAKNGDLIDFDHVLLQIRATEPFKRDKNQTADLPKILEFANNTIEEQLRHLHPSVADRTKHFLLNYLKQNYKYIEKMKRCSKHLNRP
jgi:hypothetical protein